MIAGLDRRAIFVNIHQQFITVDDQPRSIVRCFSRDVIAVGFRHGIVLRRNDFNVYCEKLKTGTGDFINGRVVHEQVPGADAHLRRYSSE